MLKNWVILARQTPRTDCCLLILSFLLMSLLDVMFIQKYFDIFSSVPKDNSSKEFSTFDLALLGTIFFGRLIAQIYNAYMVVKIYYKQAEEMTLKLLPNIYKENRCNLKPNLYTIEIELIIMKFLKSGVLLIFESVTCLVLIISLLQHELSIYTLYLICIFIPTLLFVLLNISYTKRLGEEREKHEGNFQISLYHLFENKTMQFIQEQKEIVVSLNKKYSSLKRYNFVVGINRPMLELTSYIGILSANLILLSFFGMKFDELAILFGGFILTFIKILPSMSRLLQATLDINFVKKTAKTNIELLSAALK